MAVKREFTQPELHGYRLSAYDHDYSINIYILRSMTEFVNDNITSKTLSIMNFITVKNH